MAAYAKFVDANLMNVKAQITAGTTADSSSTSIRFVTSVNDLMYQKVGFKINIHEVNGFRIIGLDTNYYLIRLISIVQIPLSQSDFSGKSAREIQNV